MTWTNFKVLIWDIYNHRINHAPEINGAINTSHLSLDEHLVVFMLHRHGSRAEAERALVAFLAALKYYMEMWPRAKTYAQMVGFLQMDDSYNPARRSLASDARFPARLNDGAIEETEIPLTDVYLQEFYLFCFNLL